MMTFGFDAPATTERLATIAPVLLEAGFEWIEIADREEHTPGYWKALDEIVARYRPRLSVHCQYEQITPTAKNREIREASLAVIKRGVDLAARWGASVAVMHGGQSSVDWSPPPGHPLHGAAMEALAADRARHHRRLREVLPALADYATARGVRLVVENLFLPWDLLLAPPEVAALLAGELAEQVGMCLDIGHAHVAGFAPEAFVAALGDSIWHAHVHGNDGLWDGHQPLAQSDMRLATSLPAIIAASPDACLIFELNVFNCTVEEIIADRQLLASLLAG